MERFEKFRYTLQNLRENRDVKQVEVANAIGIAPSSYSNYEQELHMPDYTVLIKLADYFDVTLDYLLDRTETKLSWSKQSKIMEQYDLDLLDALSTRDRNILFYIAGRLRDNPKS